MTNRMVLIIWIRDLVTQKMRFSRYLSYLMKTTWTKLLLKTWKESQLKSERRFLMINWKKCLNKQTEMEMECSTSMNSTELWEEEETLLTISIVMMNDILPLHRFKYSSDKLLQSFSFKARSVSYTHLTLPTIYSV